MNRPILLVLILFSLSIFSCSSLKKKSSEYKGHGEESVSPEDLKKYSPPALNSNLISKIQTMMDISKTSLGVISNDGKNLYVNWKVTGTSQVWKVPGPRRFPTQLTGGEDATYISSLSIDGKYLFLSRDSKGDEYSGLYKQKTSGGPLIPIYRKKKIKVSLQYVASDNRTLYFRANDIKPQNFSLYKYDLKTSKKTLLVDQKGYWFFGDVSSDGEILVGRMKTNIAAEYYLLNEKTKKLTPLFGQDENEEYRVKFGARKGEYIVLTNKFGEFRQLYKFRNGKFKNLTNSKVNVEYFRMDRGRTRIQYGTNDNGYYKAHAMSAKNFKKIYVPSFKNADHVYFGFTSRNGRYSTLGVETAKSPRTNYVYDWHSRKYSKWTMPNHPEVDTSNFSKDSLEYYETHDGVRIPMFVKRPKSCAKKVCPVIVQFHGGPESQSFPGFSPINQLFVDEGFILVKPNVRGSDGYGKSWLNSDNGEKRLDVITDIRDCSTWIRKNWSRNGNVPKVGIMGGSYGGYSTLVGMSIFAGSYDAGVASVGMSSLVTFLKNTADYRRKLRESEYGFLDKDMEALEKLSPINFLDKIKAPLMVIHGANDPRVPAGEAIQIHDEMTKRNLPSELILFSDEGHGVRKRKNKVAKYGHTLRFFNKYLK
ncbi:MAG: S9 family peptidase [Bacteriovoracaceae bacterium]|nr:S9 family peptidase [Bacteriovoracaceae bacterium]